MAIKLVFPELTSYQKEVYDWLGDPFEKGKIAVLKSVRQSGKTFFIQVELSIMAMSHPGSVSIIYEPTLALARNVFKSINKGFEASGYIKSANAQLLEIEFTNGSTILFKSTDQISRGLSVSGLLVLDECAYLDNEQIFSILPLVNAHKAPIIIASTPFTMEGYFYDMYLLGLNGTNENVKTFDWSKHPEIGRFLTEEQKELYKMTMSRQKYTTEVLGEFLTDDGLLFQNLENCVGTSEDTNVVYMGIDFATGVDDDYTVLSVMNIEGKQLKVYRTNHLSPMQQVDWLAGLILDWASNHTIRTIYGEYNSIGSVYIDALHLKLKNKQIHITDWITTNKSKQELVTAFQIALEQERVRLIDDPNLLNEMRKYQAEINPKTKSISYNGYKCHDDMVIATMLSYYAYHKGLGTFRFKMV